MVNSIYDSLLRILLEITVLQKCVAIKLSLSLKVTLLENQKAGLLTFRTNTRPGYIDPEKAGYPLDKDVEVNVSL